MLKYLNYLLVYKTMLKHYENLNCTKNLKCFNFSTQKALERKKKTRGF